MRRIQPGKIRIRFQSGHSTFEQTLPKRPLNKHFMNFFEIVKYLIVFFKKCLQMKHMLLYWLRNLMKT